jgi:hypothetical protein
MLKREKARRGISRLNDVLPNHGMLYFDHLDAERRSLCDTETDTECDNIIKDIINKRHERTITWNDLYTFELILSKRLLPEQLPRKVWKLRTRYRDIAGLREYEAYLASKPPEPTPQTQENELRSDIQYLLGEIYIGYTITPINETVRDRISKRVTTVILIGVGIIFIVVLINVMGWTTSRPVTLVPVLFVGAMGGLLSMQQRYQNAPREGDPIDNINQLSQGWSRIFLPAISGALFAVLLYMLIIAGLVEGDLFPKLSIPASDGSSQGLAIHDLLNQARPSSASDYAKLIVWSFVAGFAERFVPDTLSKFTASKGPDSKAEAVKT